MRSPILHSSPSRRVAGFGSGSLLLSLPFLSIFHFRKIFCRHRHRLHLLVELLLFWKEVQKSLPVVQPASIDESVLGEVVELVAQLDMEGH